METALCTKCELSWAVKVRVTIPLLQGRIIWKPFVRETQNQ